MSDRTHDAAQRPAAIDAASAFLQQRFPDCRAAFLAGSAARGTATPISDLDLVIVSAQEAPFRWATFRESGWPIEAWFLTPHTYPVAFAEDARKRWPLLPEMCWDGIIVRDEDGLAQRIKHEAGRILDQGPEPLTAAEIDQYRFDLTSLLDDLESSTDRIEALLLSGGIFHLTATLLLALNRRWLGQGKWLIRRLRELDPEPAESLEQALDALCRTGETTPLLQLSDAVLDRLGGRLFEGPHSDVWSRL
jgi:predicted nucleotidyltransferase